MLYSNPSHIPGAEIDPTTNSTPTGSNRFGGKLGDNTPAWNE
jgi:hypothetical protein